MNPVQNRETGGTGGSQQKFSIFDIPEPWTMSDVIADLAVQLSINDVDDSAITNLQSAIDSMADKTVDIPPMLTPRQ